MGPRHLGDVVYPGREQLQMTPVAYMGGNVIRRFQQPDGEAARKQRGGGGKADRAGPDDNDWPCFGGRSGRGGGDGVHFGPLGCGSNSETDGQSFKSFPTGSWMRGTGWSSRRWRGRKRNGRREGKEGEGGFESGCWPYFKKKKKKKK